MTRPALPIFLLCRRPAASTLAACLVLGVPAAVRAQCNGFTASGTLTGVVNSYYGGAAASPAGSTFVRVTLNPNNNTPYPPLPTGAPPIAAGDLLLIIQMQDAQIDSTNGECYGDGSDETGGACTASGSNGSGVTALNSSGLFEYVVALAPVGQGACGSAANNRICILGAGANNGLLNSYTTAPRTTTRGQRTYQVIRVPQYASATLGAGLRPYAWDGEGIFAGRGVGGVLAFDVSGTLTLAGATVNANGSGFRGARGQQLGGVGGPVTNTDYRNSVSTSQANCNFSRNVFGTKGEGIAGTPRQLATVGGNNGGLPGAPANACDGYPNGERARGAPGTAGGGGTDGNPPANDENSGGGGGGNGGAGGLGGRSFFSDLDIGGFGGATFPATLGSLNARLTPGGGGGSGSRNNSVAATAGSGASGGGIVLIRAGAVTGSATITADGLPGVPSDNDGGGGGGGGGTVVVLVESGNQDGLTITARGGQGGDAWITHDPCTPRLPPGCPPPGERHGPGGGGGGGVVFLTDAPNTAPDVSGGVNGLTTTLLDPFGATPGAPGVVTYGSLPANTPGVLTCLAVTRATLLGLRVRPGSIEFATGSQRGTRGFNVYADHDGRRARLNDALLAAPAPDSSAPLLYRLTVGSYTAERLWIEEVETSGRARWLGPFGLDDAGLREAYEAVELRLGGADASEARVDRALAHRRRPVTARPTSAGRARVASVTAPAPGTSTEALKLDVAGAGTVDVSFTDLLAAGLPAAYVGGAGALRLYELGRPVPFEVTASGLRFQAQAFDSDYTRHGVYVLAWGALRTRPPQVSFTRSGPVLPDGWMRIEQELLYAPFAPRAADPWIWDVLVHDVPAGPYAFDLPGLGAGSGEVTLRVLLSGATAHTHTVRAELNGATLETVVFTGQVAAELKVNVPRSLLLPAGNTLRLVYQASGDEPPETGLAFFDAVDLSLTLPPPTAGAGVVRLAPYDARLDVPPDTDYLIVTHADFMQQAQRLAQIKTAQGRRALAVDVERAYDRYAAGIFEAAAVHALLREVKQRAALRDVLLFGDDTFDPRDLLGEGVRSYVPSLDGWDGAFGRVPSENRYADLDGDGHPDVAIGRLPAQTLEQAALLVDKIEGQQAMLEQLAGRQLFVVDNSLPGDVSFRGMADRAASLLSSAPPPWFADIAVDGSARARATLMAALRSGVQVTHYFGHGGPEEWADEGLLWASDTPGLAGSGKQTLLLTWACEAQWYQYDWGASINEALLLTPDGGALAAVGPTGIVEPRLQVALSQAVYEHLLAGVKLGEAVRRAKAELLAADPAAGPVVEGWSLLGDPDLALPLGAPRPVSDTR